MKFVSRAVYLPLLKAPLESPNHFSTPACILSGTALVDLWIRVLVCARAHPRASYPCMAPRRCWWNMLGFCRYVLNPVWASKCASFPISEQNVEIKRGWNRLCPRATAGGPTRFCSIPSVEITQYSKPCYDLAFLMPCTWECLAQDVYLNIYLLSHVLFINSLN